MFPNELVHENPVEHTISDVQTHLRCQIRVCPDHQKFNHFKQELWEDGRMGKSIRIIGPELRVSE